jgi:hypothetical protein
MSIFTHLAPNDKYVHLTTKCGPANEEGFRLPKGITVCQKISVLIIRGTKEIDR